MEFLKENIKRNYNRYLFISEFISLTQEVFTKRLKVNSFTFATCFKSVDIKAT